MFFSIIIFLVIILSLILIHEFGHYIVGRKMGVVAEQFLIGFGPKLFAFNKGGTEFSIRLIPLGGACVFEEREIQTGYDKDGEPVYTVVDALSDVNVWKRMAIVLAGPMANFLLAFICSIIVVGNSYIDKPVIQELIEGFPAMEAGMQPGDKIISIDGGRIYVSREFDLWLAMNAGREIELVYERDGVRNKVDLIPKLDEESGRMLYGFRGHAEYSKPNPLEVLEYSFYEFRFSLVTTIKSLEKLFSGTAKADQVTGVVGMAVAVDDLKEQTLPYGIGTMVLTLIGFASMISANLGVMNLLPIPALDGGRLLFMIIEIFRGKPVPPEKEGYVHMAGFVLLAILGVLIIYNDILKIITGMQ